MKTTLINKRAGVAIAALVTSIGLSTSANAIVLAYESDPDGPGGINIGDAYVGPVQFKFVAFDNGTLYNPAGAPLTGGFSGSPGAGVAGGIAAVNALVPQIPATFAFPGTIDPGSNEDSWGVGRVTNIQTLGGVDVWSPLGKGTELTAVFHGEQDFHIQPDPSNPGFDTRVSGAGLRLDIWEDGTPGGPVDPVTTFNAALGPGGRTGAASYLNASDGTLVLSLASTAGFIHTNTGAGGPFPGFGGSATEYSTTFNFGSLTGGGQFYLNVIGGADQSIFNTNAITSPSAAFNFGAGVIPSQFSDFRGTFTSTPGQFGFDVTANDPLTGLAVPEPTTVLAGLGCMLPIFGTLFGRNRRRKIA